MSADIDIDFLDRETGLSVIKYIKAARLVEESNGTVNITPHNTGIYLQQIPHDPVTNVSSIDYKEADARGYFKIDFLNANVYNGVTDEEHLIRLMNTEPLWDLLLQDDFVNLLFHLNGHGDVLRKTCPTSVEQLAAVLAMIRPAKRHLIGKDWTTIMTEVWTRPENDDYFFKKAHAVAYAVAIVVQMNLICEKISYGYL